MSMLDRINLTNRIKEKLSGIRQDQGFNTDIGQRVLIAYERMNDTDTPCCVITPGSEVPSIDAGMNAHVDIQYSITGWTNRLSTIIHKYADAPRAEYVIVAAMIEDIRNVIEGDYCSYDDVSFRMTYETAQPFYHEENGELCGVELQYLITTPYREFMPGN